MCTLVSEELRTARKEYSCDASIWIREAGTLQYMTFAERREVAKAKSNEFKIKKGDKYIYQFSVEGGDKWSFRAIPELHKICIKYENYPEC